MSEFTVEIVPIKLENHPNADLLDLAVVGDYRAVVGKGIHKDGDLVAYIPEQAIMPTWLIDKMQLTGKLAGSAKNRVKAVRLRGEFSQGICYPAHGGTIEIEDGTYVYVKEGQDVKELLGVEKYEPTLPAHFAGKAVGVDFNITISYDFENIKKHPTIFEEGEEVVATEKLHGTFCEIGIVPSKDGNDRLWNGVGVVTSKGLAKQGILLDYTDAGNLYVKVAVESVFQKLYDKYFEEVEASGSPVFIFGEIFGANVQDLSYGLKAAEFKAFDMCRGFRNTNVYLAYDALVAATSDMGLEMVPLVYEGPYSREIAKQVAEGNTLLGGNHIREGVVFKARDGGIHARYGRKIAKSISEAYLLRKNGTEFN